jgi:hypothetical protein
MFRHPEMLRRVKIPGADALIILGDHAFVACARTLIISGDIRHPSPPVP